MKQVKIVIKGKMLKLQRGNRLYFMQEEHFSVWNRPHTTLNLLQLSQVAIDIDGDVVKTRYGHKEARSLEMLMGAIEPTIV